MRTHRPCPVGKFEARLHQISQQCGNLLFQLGDIEGVRPDPPLSNRRVGTCHHAPWLAGVVTN